MSGKDAPYWRDLPVEKRARMWWDDKPVESNEGDGPGECGASCVLEPYAVARALGDSAPRNGHRGLRTPCRNTTAPGADRCAAHGGPRKQPQRTKPVVPHVKKDHNDIAALTLRDAYRVALWFRNGGGDAFDDFKTPGWLDAWARDAASV